MTFHERIEIAKEYKIWAENNKVKDCPESVMAFLTIKGLLANSFHCVDAISRQAVLEAIRKCHCEEWIKAEIGAPIEALTSVTPAEKVGHWTKDVNESRDLFDKIRYYCSACGNWNGYGECKYCPNCGAKMQEVEE